MTGIFREKRERGKIKAAVYAHTKLITQHVTLVLFFFFCQ